jgi:hypothetical protein
MPNGYDIVTRAKIPEATTNPSGKSLITSLTTGTIVLSNVLIELSILTSLKKSSGDKVSSHGYPLIL